MAYSYTVHFRQRRGDLYQFPVTVEDSNAHEAWEAVDRMVRAKLHQAIEVQHITGSHGDGDN